MKEQHYSIKTHSYNEDRFVVKDNFFAVIDGASGLKKEEKDGVGTKASRLSSFVKSELLKYKGVFSEENLINLSVKAHNLKHEQEVSCGISIAQIVNDKLNLFFVGDCNIIVKFLDGSVKTFRQDKLTKLDDFALSQMIKYAEENHLSIKKARQELNEILIKHRNLKNLPDGYWVFEPNKFPNFVVDFYSIPISEITSVILCTDGFSQCYEKLGIFKNEVELINSELSIKDICKLIKKISFADKNCNAYPRFKTLDDTTAIKLDF